MPERLQKIIARAGITSRRKAEELITSGRVTVNGRAVRELGSQADPVHDTVCVDGKALQSPGVRRYLALNKPKGCITSTHDPEGRPTVMDLLGKEASRGIFPVGRLDYNTEGLLILTDDGDFANRVTSAKNNIIKVYEVKVSGRPSSEAIDKLRSGIKIDGRPARAESIRLLRDRDNPWYEVTLVTGRNRQIHRMFERIGFLVEKIRRVRIGNLSLRGLEPRQVKELKPKEVQQLLNPPPVPAGLADTAGPPRRTLFRKRRPTGRPERGAGDKGPARRRGRSERSAVPSSRSLEASRSRDGDSRRGRAPTGRLRRSDKPRQSPGKRQPTSSRSQPRPRLSEKAGSPRRSRAPSQARQNSRPRSRPKP